ncbi:MAG: hypothetical protein E7562_02530 [Ruminococcaceae bacterium]|nr:hypothetical protein [Oscillospiraceae bacterium]
MKRFFCLCLAFCMLLLVVGCSKDETKKKQYTTEVDVEYYANLGQMPEIKDYKLGYSVEDMLSEFAALEEASADSEIPHNHDAFFYFINEGDEFTSISTSNAEYCYKNDKREKGISCILSFDGAYGFAKDTIIIEVKEALSDYKVKEENIGEEGLSFMPMIKNADCLTYTFSKNKVTFVFTDNALCATAIYNADEWSLH